MKDASNPELTGGIETKSLKKSMNCKHHNHHTQKGSSASPIDHKIPNGKRSNSRAQLATTRLSWQEQQRLFKNEHQLLSFDRMVSTNLRHNNSNLLEMMEDEDILNGTKDQHILGLKNRTHSQMFNNMRREILLRENSTESTLDMAILHPDPLLIEVEIKDQATKRWRKELVDFNEPLEAEQEFEGIAFALKKTKKQFTIRREVATYDNLKSVMACRPKVIHISCHGDCYVDEQLKRLVYFLAFEQSERFCVLDKLTEERLRELLGGDADHGVMLVFVSACHSEMIGQLFKRVGVPVVIAVNSHSAIADEVCRKFARHFYEHLITGNPPLRAFKSGINAVKASNIDVFSCCCAHKHKSWCLWNKYGETQRKLPNFDKDDPHNRHMRNTLSETKCTCVQRSNIHSKNCAFLKNFRQQFIPDDEVLMKYEISYPIDWYEKENKNLIKLCCCQPNIPHDETQKFMIVDRDFENEKKIAESQKKGVKPLPMQIKTENQTDASQDDDIDISNVQVLTEQEIAYLQKRDKKAEQRPIFQNLKDGEFIVQGAAQVNNQLKHIIDNKMLIGRGLIIQQIIQFISDQHQRVLHLVGPDGYGKSDIANYAAKYALSGRVDLDGALYVDIEKKETKNGLIQSLCKKLSVRFVGLENKAEYKKEDIIRSIDSHRYVIIIDQCQAMIQTNKLKFNKFLRKLLEQTEKPKFIIISQNDEDIFEEKLNKILAQVLDLSRLNAAKLMMKIAGQSNHLNGFRDAEKLSKHKIFEVFPLRPQGIIQISQLLRMKSLDEIVTSRLQELEEQKKAADTEMRAENGDLAQDERLVNEGQNAEQVQQPPVQPQNPYDEFALVMKLTFEELIKKFPIQLYPNEYALLYIVCQMPSGLFEVDIDEICKINKQSADWRAFFSQISEEKVSPISQQSPDSKDQPPKESGKMMISMMQEAQRPQGENQGKNDFKFLIQFYNQEVDEMQYVPIAMVRQFITQQITQMLSTIQLQGRYEGKVVQDYFDECLKYLALLSRKFLRKRADDTRNQIDHKAVTAAIDVGIWHDEYQVVNHRHVMNSTQLSMISSDSMSIPPTANFGPFQDQYSNDDRNSKYLLISNYYESNYTTFLDLNFLKQRYQTLTYLEDSASGDLQELCICVVSFLIECNGLEEASLFLARCESIADFYKLKPLQGKLRLLKCSLEIKKRGGEFKSQEEIEENIRSLKEATKIFKDNKAVGRFKDAMAESFYLQCQLLIQICFMRMKAQKSEPVNATFQVPTTDRLDVSSGNGNIFENPNLTEKSFDSSGKGEIEYMVEFLNVRRLLENARQLYAEAGIKFGIAKSWLVEAEFILDLYYEPKFQQTQHLDQTYIDIQASLDEAKKIFEELDFKGLVARVLKQKGLFWMQRYKSEVQAALASQDQQSIASVMSKERQTMLEESSSELIIVLTQAKRCLDQALSMFERINDVDQVTVVTILQNQVLEYIQQNSHNVLIFAKSFPLVEDIRDNVFGYGQQTSVSICGSQVPQNVEYKQVGVLARYGSDFRKKMKGIATNSRQIVNLKFDILNREVIENAKQYGCKLFHISSHVFEEEKIALEGNNGLVEYLSMDQLRQAFEPTPPSTQLDIHLLVLAVPISHRFAQTFLSLGVQHVVTFGYDSILRNQPILIPQLQNMIYAFCLDFYSRLLKDNMKVQQAFDLTVNQIFDKEFSSIMSLYKNMEQVAGREVSDDLMYEGPKLWPMTEVNNQALFSTHPKEIKNLTQKQRLIDSSKKRRPNFFYRLRYDKKEPAFVGRRIIIFEMIQIVTGEPFRLVNLCGPQGIGKTRLTLELITHLNERDVFKDGIVYVDMEGVDTLEAFKERLRIKLACSTGTPNENGPSLTDAVDLDRAPKQCNQLLVMENVDCLLPLKNEISSNIINLISIFSQLKILMISRKPMLTDGYEQIKEMVLVKDLAPMSDEEAVDLIQCYCRREIYRDAQEDSVAFSSSQVQTRASQGGGKRRGTIIQKKVTLSEYLKGNQNFKQCFGFPSMLHNLATALETNKLGQINMKTLVNNSLLIDEMENYLHSYIRNARQQIDQGSNSKFGGQSQVVGDFGGPFEQAKIKGIDLGSPKFMSTLIARPSNPFNDSQVIMPSFVNDSDHERLRRDSIFNIGRVPTGSSLHSFTGNKPHPEEEEKQPGDLKYLKQKEEKELNVSRQSQAFKQPPLPTISQAPSPLIHYPTTAEEEDIELKLAIQASQMELIDNQQRIFETYTRNDNAQERGGDPMNELFDFETAEQLITAAASPPLSRNVSNANPDPNRQPPLQQPPFNISLSQQQHQQPSVHPSIFLSQQEPIAPPRQYQKSSGKKLSTRSLSRGASMNEGGSSGEKSLGTRKKQ